MERKVHQLREILRANAPLLIAYSGGVDSAFLLAIAHATLGGSATGIIADSPSLPRQALADALALAKEIGARVEVIRTEEMADPNYVGNPMNRCYFCKAELFLKMEAVARGRNFAAIAYGENADDAAHFRPGSKAAAEFSVIAPLKTAGLSKAEIRELSRELNLPTADASAQPCLSSRIPHGTPVTAEALAMIERGEALVRSLGFKVFRVRHLAGERGEKRARLQIAPAEMQNLTPAHELLRTGLLAAGYHSIEIDPNGYQSPS